MKKQVNRWKFVLDTRIRSAGALDKNWIEVIHVKISSRGDDNGQVEEMHLAEHLIFSRFSCGMKRKCFRYPKVYISDGRPLFVLSEAQKEEVIAQADTHLKTARGRGYRRQITRPEGDLNNNKTRSSSPTS